jgi:HKD family nuclease
MFYNQPLATRFGTDLICYIKSGVWNSLDIGVAWVRASGVAHLRPALEEFLANGNKLGVVVGVDIDNTTKEGLEGLLALEVHGDATVYVHHNEAGSIFHPKIYLFRNASKAKLIVGSNNITESGLFRNTEAGLEINADVNDSIIVSAINALDTWSDTADNLAHRLNSDFLGKLVSYGYVKDEKHLLAEAKKRRASSSLKYAERPKLFGSMSVSLPLKPGSSLKQSKLVDTKDISDVTVTGHVLLMRVRKAQAKDRPTQTQIPKVVANSTFFGDITTVISKHTSETHKVSPAIARGIVNTLKLEIPEMRKMTNPVVRFERTDEGVKYECYDAENNPKGKAIMEKLNAGLFTSPIATHLTKPSTPDSSTWWCFI